MAVTKKIVFGEISGIKEGQSFDNRREMMPSAFHRNWAQGIDGNPKEGAAAIALSGGYADDEDYGDEGIYTGAGGNKNGRQVEDQTWSHTGNGALLTSMNKGLPVRIVRGHKHRTEYSPKSGYRYGGLYSVTEAWEDKGVNGFKVCRYRLEYIGEYNKPLKSGEEPPTGGEKERKYSSSTIIRFVRNGAIAVEVKELYKYKCQVCRTALTVKGGFYAEGAHIKPVGKPHNGPDVLPNLLCLCPNHHVLFDRGSFSIADDHTLLGIEDGKLHAEHGLGTDFLKYHRTIHGYE